MNIQKKNLLGEWADYIAKITLNDDKISIEGSNVTNSGSTIVINSAGTYYLTGNISEGNILINANKNDDIQLVLDNVSINCTTTSPINCTEAGKLTITLAENSTNTITDGNSYTNFTDTVNLEPDGTIFTKSDLLINGTGTLVVNSNYLDGIVSKDELKIVNSNIKINAEDDAIRGKDYVGINNANIEVICKGDGIKSTNNTDENLGYIVIEGGNININSEADGIQAETILNISENPTINITTNGEIAKSNQNFEFGPNQWDNQMQNTDTEEATASSKGLKAGKEITIENGNITIASTDDSIHSNGIIIINNGEIKTSSEDDGIHADTNIVINGGNIEISKSYEGIESAYVAINDGKISIVSSDDGINIAGGNDSSSIGGRIGQNNFSTVEDSNKVLFINGGELTVNANGDGLDSNGAIQINGGKTIIAGPTSGGNGSLDYTTECIITAGDVIIYGTTEMWLNPSNSSTQYCLTFQTFGNSGDEIVLKNASGKEINSFKAEKAYQVIAISNQEIEKGEQYSLYVNGTQVETLEVNDIITTSNNFSNTQNMNQFPQEGGGQRRNMEMPMRGNGDNIPQEMVNDFVI